MKVPPCEKNNNNSSSRLVPGGNPVKSGLTGRNLFRSVQNLDVLNEENFERLNSFPMKPALSQQSIYVGNNNSDLVDQLMDSDGENNNQQQVLAGEWHDPATNPDDFSSVEDLLVNMSHTMRSELELNLMADDTAPNTAFTVIEATARGHNNNRHSWRSCDDEMAPLLSDDCYQDIKPQARSYDRDTNLNYRSLPRSRQMKIKKPAESDPTFSKKQPCKSELYKCKSQSSIIARREVPPTPIETDVNRVKTRIMRLPF
uniref:Uncharacterized protein n=1 Tax=Ciona savignyi TaxID=51511 RepID=H2Z3K0_CIOSA